MFGCRRGRGQRHLRHRLRLRLTLRTAAARILFGRSLADKLAPVGEFDDSSPGPPLLVDLPGRPPELRFHPGRIREPVPRSLTAERTRGLLLHRFANHELLAIEAMCSALLRFPDAPRPFRLGLARTLADEQVHLGLYLARMAELGVHPGDAPVNDYFWRSMADVATPRDYLARMALTFEQANLDFMRYYRGRFREVGDDATVAVLDRVYADELTHVRFGLRQFGTDGLYEAHAAALPEPLSLARARGPVFDREGRVQVGFPASYIDRLELFTRSRGRLPRAFLPNFTVEDEIARRTPSASLRTLTADLAPVLAFVASHEDLVVTPILPTDAWRRSLADAGFPLPEFVTEVGTRRVSEIRPWGRLPTTPVERAVWSKCEAVAWRSSVIDKIGEPWLAPDDVRVLHTRPEAEAALARGEVLKAPYSSAGRHRVRGAASARWLDRLPLRAEPWRDRVLDLSLHFDVGTRMRFVGICRFLADERGQFSGTVPGRWADDLDPDLRRFLVGDGKDPRRLRRVAAALVDVLEPVLLRAGIAGPVGVDTFVYRDGDGFRLDPLVELNPRLTMGRVSLALGRHVHPQSRARWHFRRPAAVETDPVQLRDGLIASGTLHTNDPATARSVQTILTVRPASG